jgi:hypothetical protein
LYPDAKQLASVKSVQVQHLCVDPAGQIGVIVLPQATEFGSAQVMHDCVPSAATEHCPSTVYIMAPVQELALRQLRVTLDTTPCTS